MSNVSLIDGHIDIFNCEACKTHCQYYNISSTTEEMKAYCKTAFKPIVKVIKEDLI